MTYSQCKCGELQFWGSGMSPARCSPCEKCGTVPASHPDRHPEPVPHDYYVSSVETDAGTLPLTRCRLCNRTKAQIEGYARAPRDEGGRDAEDHATLRGISTPPTADPEAQA